MYVRPAWFKRYWPMLEEMFAHTTTVEAKMLKAIFYGNRAHSVALKFTFVGTLAGKAEFHGLVRRNHRYSPSGYSCLVRPPRVYFANPSLINPPRRDRALFFGLAPSMDALIVARAFAGKGGSG